MLFWKQKGFNVLGTGPALAQQQNVGNKAGEPGPSGSRREDAPGLGGGWSPWVPAPRGPVRLAQLGQSWRGQHPRGTQKHPAPQTPSGTHSLGGLAWATPLEEGWQALISTLMAVISSPSPWSRAGDAPWRYPRAGLISPIIPADGLSSGALPVRHRISCWLQETGKNPKASPTNPARTPKQIGRDFQGNWGSFFFFFFSLLEFFFF